MLLLTVLALTTLWTLGTLLALGLSRAAGAGDRAVVYDAAPQRQLALPVVQASRRERAPVPVA